MLQPTMKAKRVVQLELNELSRDIIDNLVKRGKLPTFKKINSDWSYLRTSSETSYEKIEPWIQWITAHTGKNFAEHGVFRLSDAHELRHAQIWEVLSSQGIESAVIGAMNATRGATNGGIFFPDPWAKTNEAYPPQLQPLWQILAERVQAHASTQPSVATLARAGLECFRFGLPLNLYTKIAAQLVRQRLKPDQKWRLAALFDLFQAEIFLSVLRRSNFGYYTLFLNANAHYQHHFWRNFDRSPFAANIVAPDCAPEDDPITYGYEIYDDILHRVLAIVANDPNTITIIATGLSQIPYTEKETEGGMNYYRLNDHQAFAAKLGLDAHKVFPLMSRDWQLQIDDDASTAKLQHLLQSITVEGENLFAVRQDTKGYLHIETAVTKAIAKDALIQSPSQTLGKFHDLFTTTAVKSGHHVGVGSLWINEPKGQKIAQPQMVPLAEIFSYSLRALTHQEFHKA